MFKKKFKLLLWFSLPSIFLTAVSCSSISTESELKDFHNFYLNTRKENNPRYKYLLALVAYFDNSFKQTFEQLRQGSGEVAAKDLTKFAASIQAKHKLFNLLKNELSIIPLEKINDSNQGIASLTFLEKYKFIHGENENRFRSLKDTTNDFLYLGDFNLLSQGLLYNHFIYINSQYFPRDINSDIYIFYNQFQGFIALADQGKKNLFYNLAKDVNSNNHLDKRLQKYQQLISQNVKEKSNLTNIQSNWEKLLKVQKELIAYFGPFFDDMRQIFQAIDTSFFKTLSFEPILDESDFLKIKNYFNFLTTFSDVYYITMSDLMLSKQDINDKINNLILNMQNSDVFNNTELNKFKNNLNNLSNEQIYKKLLNIFNDGYNTNEFKKQMMQKINNYIKKHSKELYEDR
ncbi:hypothetical protein ACXYRO_01460 [Mycoplasma sp. 4013]